MRAVLDTNVLISGVLSPIGAPGQLLRAWRDGAFELVTSPLLLDELARALAYPKLARRIVPMDAAAFVSLLRSHSDLRLDPVGPPPVRTRDPNDDFLITLAATATSVIVSGDDDLLALAGTIPVFPPAVFLEMIADG